MNKSIKTYLISRFIIRIFDIVLSTIGLLFFSPIMLIIVIVLSLNSERQVFYRQIRVGKYKRHFELFKFTTMLKNSPYIATGELTLKNDYRVIPAGKFLRKTKLNELPQLFNILKGDMSIIGPRPQTPNYFLNFKTKDKKNIIKVRPGLSGLSSIIFRNEDEIFSKVTDPLSFDKKVVMKYKGELESWFVCNQSVYLYFKLIFITIVVLIWPKYSLCRNLIKNIPTPPLVLKNIISG